MGFRGSLIHGLMFLLNAMVPVEYEYEQYHYGTVKLCQSPGSAGGFLKGIRTGKGCIASPLRSYS